MDNGKYVLVPQHDIDAIEKSRCAMHEVLEFNGVSDKIISELIFEMGGSLWNLTHRKYHTINIEESTMK